MIINDLVVLVVDPEDRDGDDKGGMDDEEPEMDSKEPDHMDKDDMDDDVVAIAPEGDIKKGQVIEDITKVVPRPPIEIA